MDYKCNYKWKIHRLSMFTNVNNPPFRVDFGVFLGYSRFIDRKNWLLLLISRTLC